MSGSIGANRIPREAVAPTVKKYIEDILKKYPPFRTAKISGSYNTVVKADHGDIDLIIHIDAGEDDKKLLKKKFAEYLNSLPNDVIVPFKAGRHQGKKTAGTGDIVIAQIPIEGYPDLTVQVDNMIVTSEQESGYRKSFLDIPGEKQALLIGLAKTILMEENPEEVFKRLGINNLPKLEPNQEFEFNLSSKGLTLRLVTLDDNYRELSRNDIWDSFDWNDVVKLFSKYDLNSSFEDLLNKVKTDLKNPRSKNRIKGLFKSMLVIGAGEKGTPKGDNKEAALDAIDKLLEGKLFKSLTKSLIKDLLPENFEYSKPTYKKTIALYPGKFKPPHKGHLEVAKSLLDKADEVIIIISPNPVDGITAEQSLDIWNRLYLPILGSDKIKAIISPTPSPIKYVLDTIENDKDNFYLTVYGKGDESRYKNVGIDPRYKNGKTIDGGSIKFEDVDISATNLRQALSDNTDITPWLPDGITPEEYKNALGLEQVQELFEPSSNSYEYDQVTSLDYSFMSDYGRIYVVGITPESEGRISIDFGIEDEYGDISFPETNEKDVFKIIATVSNIVKDYLSKHPDIEIISWSSVAKKGEKKIGDTQRDKLYKLVAQRQGNLKDEDIVRKDNEYWAYLKGYNPMFENELPAPTQNFFNPIQDKQIDFNISSEPTRVDYYKDHIQNVIPSDFKVEKHKDKIVVTPTPKQQNLENNLEFKELLVSLTMYMIDHINIDPLPDLIFVEDDVKNAKDMLGRTAHYNHNDKSITLYTYGRHPKDILRSYAHEMIHHKQNLEGRLQNQINTQNINEDDYLKEIEEEAYRLGNGLLFRGWENSIK